MSNDNTRDPFGLPNEDKYDATTVARKRYGPDDGDWDPEFGGLDRHGCGIGSKELKSFLTAATEASDPHKPRAFRLRASNGQEVPVQVSRRGALWIALAPLNGEWREFHEKTYERLLALLMKTYNQGPRNLTEAQRLTIARLCVPGPNLPARMAQAMTLYLEYRCGEEVDETIINDPSFANIVNEGVKLIFVCSEPGFMESRAAWEYMERYRGKNRQWSIPLCKSAWKSFQENQTTAQPTNEQSEPQRVTEEDLSAMTDDALATLYGGVLSKHAHDVQKLRDRLHGR